MAGSFFRSIPFPWKSEEAAKGSTNNGTASSLNNNGTGQPDLSGAKVDTHVPDHRFIDNNNTFVGNGNVGYGERCIDKSTTNYKKGSNKEEAEGSNNGSNNQRVPSPTTGNPVNTTRGVPSPTTGNPVNVSKVPVRGIYNRNNFHGNKNKGYDEGSTDSSITNYYDY